MRDVIAAFDKYLAGQGLTFDATITERDANPLWPDHVRVGMDHLKGMLGHESGNK
jgi:hypothetical protein